MRRGDVGVMRGDFMALIWRETRDEIAWKKKNRAERKKCCYGKDDERWVQEWGREQGCTEPGGRSERPGRRCERIERMSGKQLRTHSKQRGGMQPFTLSLNAKVKFTVDGLSVPHTHVWLWKEAGVVRGNPHKKGRTQKSPWLPVDMNI